MELIRPMLAIAGMVPVARGDQFAYEIKWDGVRLITYATSRVTAYTRNDREVSGSYPELGELIDALGGRRAVLDGEVVAFNNAGVVHFGTLQQRMHVTDPAVVHELMVTVPVVYVIFDVLSLDGKKLIDQSYEQRRELLQNLDLAGPHVQVPLAIDGRLDHALKVSAHMKAEGVVAKRFGSRHQPGRRSPDWIKTKHIRMQEVVIGGWRPGAGGREGRIGSLLVGIPTKEGLRYVGRVGTGFTAKTLDHLAELLAPLATRTSPFIAVPRDVIRDAHWVRAELVGEVSYGESTTNGHLRHPAWRGIRPDKQPSEVIRE